MDPNQPLLTPTLLRRILAVSVFNWILIFGIFEWVRTSMDDVMLARTMAIQALVAARIIYLLSISQLWAKPMKYLRYPAQAIADAPILLSGIAIAFMLQILFSQWSVMNALFATVPLTWNQWLICLLPMLPMVPMAILTNRIDPPQATIAGSPNAHRPSRDVG